MELKLIKILAMWYVQQLLYVYFIIELIEQLNVIFYWKKILNIIEECI